MSQYFASCLQLVCTDLRLHLRLTTVLCHLPRCSSCDAHALYFHIFYPHKPIGKVWICRLLFVFCLLVRLRISPPRIKPAASNFARRFIGVQGRESQIFVNFAPQEAQKSDESASARATPTRAASGRRIGMCGHPPDPITDRVVHSSITRPIVMML